jgi:hypothetical protein
VRYPFEIERLAGSHSFGHDLADVSAEDIFDRECAIAHLRDQAPGLELRGPKRHPEELLRVLVVAEVVVEALQEMRRRLLGAQAVQDRVPSLVANVERRVVGEDRGSPRTHPRDGRGRLVITTAFV